MRHPRKWLRRLGKLALVLAVLALLVRHWLLPLTVRRVLLDQLAEIGLPDARLEVVRVSPWELVVDNISFDASGRTRLARLSVAYSPSSLWHGRVTNIDIQGAAWTPRWRNGKLDLGAVAQIRLPARSPNTPPSALPFDRITVRDSNVTVEWEGHRWMLPIAATVQRQDGRKLQVELRTDILAMSARAWGTIDTQTGALSLDTSWPGNASAVNAPAKLLIHYERHQGHNRTTVTAAFHQQELAGRWAGVAWAVDELKAVANVDLDDAWTVAGLQANLDVAALRLGHHTTDQLSLTARKTEDLLNITAVAQNKGEEPQSLRLELPATLTALTGKQDAAAAVACRFSGVPPAWLIHWLANQGIAVAHAGRVQADGQARFVRRVNPSTPAQTTWALAVEQITLSLAESDLTVHPAGLTLQGLAGKCMLQGEIRPGVIKVQLLQPVELSCQNVRTTTTNPVTAGPVKFTLQSADRQPVLEITTSGEHPDVQAAGIVSLTGPLWIRCSAWQGNIAGLSLRGSLRFSPGAPPQIDAEAVVEQAGATNSVYDLAVSGISLRLPIQYHAAQKRPAEFKIGAVRYGPINLTDLHGAAQISDGAITLNIATPPTESLHLESEIHLQLTGARPSGEIRASLTDFHITDPDWLANLVPAAKGSAVTGTFSLHTVLQIEDGRVYPWATLEVKNAAVASTAWDAGAEGVDAVINFNRLTPLGTPPSQWITVKKAHSGKLNLHDGLIQFTMHAPTSVLVERTRWTLGDKGQFWVHAFWMDPAAPEINLEVFLEDLNIKDLLALVAQGKVRGDGLIYGRLPVTLRPGKKPFLVPGQGFLYAQPGAGWFEVQDKSDIQKMLANTQASMSAQLQQQIVDALSDFEYTLFKVELVSDQGELVLRISAQGKGRHGDHPQEFSDLTINIRGIEGLLDLVLRAKR